MTEEELHQGLAEDVKTADNVIVAVGKNCAIRFCLSKGASVDWCNSLRDLDYFNVVQVAGICYGFLNDVDKETK